MIGLRAATAADTAGLEALIARSARGLSAADYRAEQIEGALRGAFGVDSQLIADGTYFVAEERDQLVGAGGWSFRATLFGGDGRADRDASVLQPGRHPARIRAFFVDPAHARRGIGSLLLAHCEAAARARGYERVELMATLPGMRLYAARGYVPGALVRHALGDGQSIEFIPMHKDLGPPPA